MCGATAIQLLLLYQVDGPTLFFCNCSSFAVVTIFFIFSNIEPKYFFSIYSYHYYYRIKIKKFVRQTRSNFGYLAYSSILLYCRSKNVAFSINKIELKILKNFLF